MELTDRLRAKRVANGALELSGSEMRFKVSRRADGARSRHRCINSHLAYRWLCMLDEMPSDFIASDSFS
jgi:hypothetical protein